MAAASRRGERFSSAPHLVGLLRFVNGTLRRHRLWRLLTVSLRGRHASVVMTSVHGSIAVESGAMWKSTAQCLRNRDKTKNMPTGSKPQTEYAIFHAQYLNNNCCFNYGNTGNAIHYSGPGTPVRPRLAGADLPVMLARMRRLRVGMTAALMALSSGPSGASPKGAGGQPTPPAATEPRSPPTG